jgi:HAMP domain-containing protein
MIASRITLPTIFRHLPLAVLMVVVILGLSGCNTLPEPVNDERLQRELAQLQSDLAREINVRQRLAMKVIAAQRELQEIDNLLRDLDELQVDVQARLSRLMGKPVTQAPRATSAQLAYQWGLIAIGLAVIIILNKIHRSRIREQRRLARLRDALNARNSRAALPDDQDGDDRATATQPDTRA